MGMRHGHGVGTVPSRTAGRRFLACPLRSCSAFPLRLYAVVVPRRPSVFEWCLSGPGFAAGSGLFRGATADGCHGDGSLDSLAALALALPPPAVPPRGRDAARRSMLAAGRERPCRCRRPRRRAHAETGAASRATGVRAPGFASELSRAVLGGQHGGKGVHCAEDPTLKRRGSIAWRTGASHARAATPIRLHATRFTSTRRV
eukprot:366044-Chlamydomonas_euryale.AAC.4